MEQMLYTVAEVAKILKTNTSYVYNLIKLGSYKIRGSTLEKFLQEYENKDLTDLTNVKELKVV